MTTSVYEPRVLIRKPLQNGMTARAVASHAIASIALGPVCALRAAINGTPGMRFHLEGFDIASRLVLHGGSRSLVQAAKLVVLPLDSTRYFEFDWVWMRLKQRQPAKHYLDVSSPRLLPLRYARRRGVEHVTLVNPDADDLRATADCAAALHLTHKCAMLVKPVEAIDFGEQRFDVVTSISVLEHIRDEATALRAIWRTVAPGGILVLTLPCVATGYDQYRDFNEYNIGDPSPEGLYFFQRFYDARSLEERIYSVVGRPNITAIYGESIPGYFGRNAEQKMRGLPYPFWREPLMMSENFRMFPSIDQLPGEGVVAMEFVKEKA